MKKISQFNRHVLAAAFFMPVAVLLPAAAPAEIAQATDAPESVWLTTVRETPQGSFVMGNPDAPTKLVEYASYTCGHCATFDAKDAPRLEAEKVADGLVSFEMRSLVRDPIDLTVAMLARCGGPDKFFGNHRFLMAQQANIGERTKRITQPTADRLQANDVTGFLIGAYDEMKLDELMAPRGISSGQAKICLADQSAFEKLLSTTDAAGPTYNIQGTPSFLINDKLAAGAHDYDSLKPMLAIPAAAK